MGPGIGVRAKELAIGYMRKPGERMPVGAVVRGECPADRLRRHALFDVIVPEDVILVVDIDEAVAERLAEDRQYRHEQEHANERRGKHVTLASRRRESPFAPRKQCIFPG